MIEVFVQEVRFDHSAVQGLLAEWDGELGFSPRGGSTVAANDFTSPDGVFLLAARGATPVGCGGLRRLTGTRGEVKRVFVRRAARGRGVGRTLLAGLEQCARERGFRELRLDTDGEAAALALFRSAGYELIADYNANPSARYWFEKRLPSPEGGA